MPESLQWPSTASFAASVNSGFLQSYRLYQFDPQLFKHVPTLNTMVPMVIEILQLRDTSNRNDSYVSCKCRVTREKILELGVTCSARKLKESPMKTQVFTENKMTEMCTLTFLHKLCLWMWRGRCRDEQEGRHTDRQTERSRCIM